MAFTFPIAKDLFADLLNIRTVSFRLTRYEEYSGLAAGEILGAEMAAPKWMADVASAPMYHRDAMDIQAVIESLDGVLNSFMLYNPLTNYPRADPTGATLGAATPVISALNVSGKEISISGLPAGYVLSRGDMLEIPYLEGARAGLFRVLQTVTASAGGVVTNMEIRPHIRVGMDVGDPIELRKPAGKFIMIPDTFQIETDTLKTSTIRFQALQIF